METVMDLIRSEIVPWLTSTGIKIIIALVIFLIAFRVINTVCKKLTAALEKKESLDTTVTRTLGYAANVALKGLVLICLVGYLGIDTTGLSAVIASLGVAAGLAVNGTLSNLAGGVMILLTRPFRVGDYISAMGNEGIVENIFICNTQIISPDNKVIYLPNSALSTGTIVNFSTKKTRRVDLTFSIAGNDPSMVRAALLDICDHEELILSDPVPFARVTDYGSGNGVQMTLRAWTATENYWDACFNLLDAAQASFEAKDIVVPFNQLDVHMK